VEYSTSFHLWDGMMSNIPHHFLGQEAVPNVATECYNDDYKNSYVEIIDIRDCRNETRLEIFYY